MISILPGGVLALNLCDELFEWKGSEVSLVPAPDSDDGSVLCFLLTDDEHVRDPLKLCLADLVSDLLVACIVLHADTGGHHLIDDLRRVCPALLGNR